MLFRRHLFCHACCSWTSSGDELFLEKNASATIRSWNVHKTSQESLFKVFYYNNRGIKKVKNLQKFWNKEIYFTLQNNNRNYNKPFKFITWTNTFKDHSAFTTATWTQSLITGLKRVPMAISLPFGTHSSVFSFLSFDPCLAQNGKQS